MSQLKQNSEPNKKRAATIIVLLIFGLAVVSYAVLSSLSSSDEQTPAQIVRTETSTEGVLPSRASLAAGSLPDTAPDIQVLNSNPARLDQVGSSNQSQTSSLQQPPVVSGYLGEPPSVATILAAQQAAQQAKQDSQAYQASLKSALSANLDEQKSLAKVEVNYAITQWRLAWMRGDTAKYLASYSSDFEPESGVDRERWEAGRRQRVLPARTAQISVTGLIVDFDPGFQRAQAQFKQDYQSVSHQEIVRKELILAKEGVDWKIVAERQLKPVQDN